MTAPQLITELGPTRRRLHQVTDTSELTEVAPTRVATRSLAIALAEILVDAIASDAGRIQDSLARVKAVLDAHAVGFAADEGTTALFLMTNTMAPPQDGWPVFVEPLTDKQREVLTLAATPMSNDEIARALHLSVNTVRTHMRAVMRKLGTSRRNDAIRRARHLQVI